MTGAALIAGALWAIFGSPFVAVVGQSCAIFAVAALGQSVLIGRAGQVAFSGAAFMAIGAFTTGLLAGTALEPFPLPLILSAVVGWAVGLVAGLPGLRFQGLYLLMASLALQFIVNSITQQYQDNYAPGGLTVPLMHIGSLDLSRGRPLTLALLVVVVLVCVAVGAVERTGVGLAWRTIKESELAASIAGVDVIRWKLYAFAASGAVTAVAGSLFAYVAGRADYQSYGLTLSITLLTMIFVGGVNSGLGAVLGAVLITTLPYVLQNNVPGLLGQLGIDSEWYQLNQSEVNAGLFSLLFLLVVLFEPGGIESVLRRVERFGRSQLTRGSATRKQELR
ncbi:MAG: branched-chain amino acid ABC transporter permease [Nocardioidaceae bacterium]